MAYTPNDIYDYIIENDRESEFLQAITQDGKVYIKDV